MVTPSRPDLEVVGVFNPGVTRHNGDVVLLLRVAEAPLEKRAGSVAAPIYNAGSQELEFKWWTLDAEGLDVSDPRSIGIGGQVFLTSISHLRVARSKDGVHFDVEKMPALSPVTFYESFGCEDARITFIDDTWWINYSAVSSLGISTALASTKDFKSFERHGIIFPPDNRDVTIFPEKVSGHYFALHRPMPDGVGHAAMWSASSPDLIAWGNHKFVADSRPGWDDLKVGGGAVPFRVKSGKHDGWLEVYHGVTKEPPTYSLGALLLDPNDPSVVLARSSEPILRPETDYEREGFYAAVVFTCGVLYEEHRVRIYYGAADGVVAVAELSLEEILAGLSEL
jgi:beta-1,2-mannobiose phosphorylase / 1,2-beta-oligomannan phosphorylase